MTNISSKNLAGIIKKYRTLKDISIKNPEERLFEGWGSVEVIDKQNDLIPIEEFETVIDILIKRGAPIMDSHSNHSVGKILSYEFKDTDNGKKGLYLKGKIFNDYPSDDIVWSKIKKNIYTGFSLGGKANNKTPICDYDGCHNIVTDIEAWEFSIVETPANQDSLITNVNKLAKSGINKTTDIIDSILKLRTYINDPSEAPKGVKIEEGPEGGHYYESSPKRSKQQDKPKKEHDVVSYEYMLQQGQKNLTPYDNHPKLLKIGDFIDKGSIKIYNESKDNNKEIAVPIKYDKKLKSFIFNEDPSKRIMGTSDSVSGVNAGSAGIFHTHPPPCGSAVTISDIGHAAMNGLFISMVRDPKSSWVILRTKDTPDQRNNIMRRKMGKLRFDGNKMHVNKESDMDEYYRLVLDALDTCKMKLYVGDDFNHLHSIESIDDFPNERLLYKFDGEITDISELLPNKDWKSKFNSEIDDSDIILQSTRDTKSSVTKIIDSILKSRTYIKDPSKAPKGVKVEQGPKGGHYYESSSEISDKPKKDTPKEKNKRIGGGLIGDIYNFDKNHIIKVIKKNPKDRYGNNIDRKDLIQNEENAILYNNKVSDDLKLFPKTIKTKNNEFIKEKLYDVDFENVNESEKIRFANALIEMLKNDYALFDGVQTMKSKDDKLKVFDADGFISIKNENNKFKDAMAYNINYYISQKLGIGDWITTFCTVENTIQAFENYVKNK